MTLATKPDAIVVSGLSDLGRFGGGIYVVGDHGVEVVDELPTSGISFDEATGRWLRAMSARELGIIGNEVREYRASGRIVKVSRLGTLFDVHDVYADGTLSLAVGTHENSLFELGGHRPFSSLVLPGEPDSWHLNCLENVGGEIFASAFHRGGAFRQWSGNAEGKGFVFSLASGAIVANGLTMPHSPRFVEGLWHICNSGRNELIAVDPLTPLRQVHRVELGGYTRGLAFDSDNFYVGISRRRHREDDGKGTASIAVVNRTSWNLIERIPIPCPEIYDILLVPEWAPGMLKTSMPETEGDTVNGLATTKRPPGTTAQSDGIPDGLSIRFLLPDNIHAGDVFFVPTRIEHSGGEALVTSPDTPLQISYRWTGTGDVPLVSVGQDEPLRTQLPPTLNPGSYRDVDVVVRAPVLAGHYRLRVVLVKEHVRWLDETEPQAFLDAEVVIKSPTFSPEIRRRTTPRLSDLGF
jgi:uncharacterized protein DUF4915